MNKVSELSVFSKVFLMKFNLKYFPYMNDFLEIS